jgi:hypothetical protein
LWNYELDLNSKASNQRRFLLSERERSAKVKLMKEILTIEQPETKEEEPKISYHIFYGPHWTDKDFENLKNAFDKADIYVPELVGWDFRIKDNLNRLSQGEFTPEEVAAKEHVGNKSAHLRQYRLIYNSKKPILFADMPLQHKLIPLSFKNDELGKEALELFEKGDFKSSFKKIYQYTIAETDYEKKREELIKKNLEEEVKKLVKTDSCFKDKSDVRVLLSLGAVHTGIYHQFKKEETPASREFSRQPFIFDSMAQALREMMLSRRKKPDKLLLARGLVEALTLYDYINRRISFDNSKLMPVLRKISSRLKFKDIKNICREMGKDSNRTILDVLEKRGLEIPRTEAEMDEMLSGL